MTPQHIRKFAAALIAVAIVATSSAAFAAQNVPVKTLQLGTVENRRLRHYFGTVQGSQRVSLSFRVAGPLIELPIEMGTRMKKGDLVGRIDPRDFRTRLEQAKSQLSQAQAKSTQAQKDYSRYEELYKKSVVSKAEYDSYRTANDVARSAVKTAQADVAAAQNALDDTELRAPFNGIIVARLVENYEDVQAKQPIASLQNLDDVEIIINVPEADVATTALAGGNPIPDSEHLADLIDLEVTLDSLPGSSFKATFKEISVQADPLMQTYSITLTMPQPENVRVLPGMSVSVATSIVENKDSDVTFYSVPLNALVGDVSGNTWLWKTNSDGTIQKVPVKPGSFIGDTIEVTGDLNPGDIIVSTGARGLTEGDTIKVKD